MARSGCKADASHAAQASRARASHRGLRKLPGGEAGDHMHAANTLCRSRTRGPAHRDQAQGAHRAQCDGGGGSCSNARLTCIDRAPPAQWVAHMNTTRRRSRSREQCAGHRGQWGQALKPRNATSSREVKPGQAGDAGTPGRRAQSSPGAPRGTTQACSSHPPTSRCSTALTLSQGSRGAWGCATLRTSATSPAPMPPRPRAILSEPASHRLRCPGRCGLHC